MAPNKYRIENYFSEFQNAAIVGERLATEDQRKVEFKRKNERGRERLRVRESKRKNGS